MRNEGRAPHGGGRGERGVALLEFAVCMPVLAVLVFGMIDIGRVFVVRESLQNAAREAAVFAAAHPGQLHGPSSGGCPDPSNAEWRGHHEGASVSNYAFTFSPDITSCTTDPAQLSSLPPGAPLRVRASTKMGMLTPYFPAQLTIASSVCVSVSGARPSGAPCP